jgi:hypothetical protein
MRTHISGMQVLALAAAFLSTVQGQTPPPAPVPGQAQPGGRGGRGAKGRGGRVAPPARIVKFSAQPATVQSGKPAQLVWATENPNGVTIEPDLGRVTARGTKQVNPKVTTTYTLKIGMGDTPDLVRSVTVTVPGTTPAAGGAEVQAEVKFNPRLPDGKPDLSGVYNFAGVRGAVAPALQPGAEKFKIIRGGPGDVRGTTTLGTDCKPLGIPQSFVTPYPFQIVQTLKMLVMIFEYPNAVRFIPTDGRAHPADPDPTWMGNGVGRWDGDTLVVDSIGFNDKTEVSGFMHTESLHVVERYHRLDNGSLQYDVTVEDPNVWVSPWIMPQRTFAFRPELETVDEFVCESNQDYGKLFKKE